APTSAARAASPSPSSMLMSVKMVAPRSSRAPPLAHQLALGSMMVCTSCHIPEKLKTRSMASHSNWPATPATCLSAAVTCETLGPVWCGRAGGLGLAGWEGGEYGVTGGPALGLGTACPPA